MAMRPQNTCGHCGYTWYPRGKDLSNKCPNCGSRSVGMIPFQITGGVVVFFLIMGCCVTSSVMTLVNKVTKRDDAQLPAANVKQQQTEKEKEPHPPESKKGASPKTKGSRVEPHDPSMPPDKPKPEPTDPPKV